LDALRRVWEVRAEECQPLAEIASLIVWSQGNSVADQDAARRAVNPYREILERLRLQEKYAPLPTRYLMDREHLPAWVANMLPLGEAAAIAHGQPVVPPPDVVGVYGAPGVFCGWCRKRGGFLVVAYFCRREGKPGDWVILTNWDNPDDRVVVRLPEITCGGYVHLEWREWVHG